MRRSRADEKPSGFVPSSDDDPLVCDIPPSQEDLMGGGRHKRRRTIVEAFQTMNLKRELEGNSSDEIEDATSSHATGGSPNLDDDASSTSNGNDVESTTNALRVVDDEDVKESDVTKVPPYHFVDASRPHRDIVDRRLEEMIRQTRREAERGYSSRDDFHLNFNTFEPTARVETRPRSNSLPRDIDWKIEPDSMDTS